MQRGLPVTGFWDGTDLTWTQHPGLESEDRDTGTLSCQTKVLLY